MFWWPREKLHESRLGPGSDPSTWGSRSVWLEQLLFSKVPTESPLASFFKVTFLESPKASFYRPVGDLIQAQGSSSVTWKNQAEVFPGVTPPIPSLLSTGEGRCTLLAGRCTGFFRWKGLCWWWPQRHGWGGFGVPKRRNPENLAMVAMGSVRFGDQKPAGERVGRDPHHTWRGGGSLRRSRDVTCSAS